MELLQSRKECLCSACIEEVYHKHSYHWRFRVHKTNTEYKKRGKTTRTNNELWRPWTESEENSKMNKPFEWKSYENVSQGIQSPPQFQHPVKLIWPKKPYDYMYAEGEKLLRDFPIQATLEFAPDLYSDSEDEDDFDDEIEEETKIGDAKKSVNGNQQ